MMALWSMIRKSAKRFSEKIMLKHKSVIVIQSNWIAV
jgi:hypothetical protein